MKKLIFIMTLLVSAFNLPAQTPVSSNFTAEELKVNATVVKFFDALTELDLVKLKLQVTKDFMLLEEGEIWNTDSLSNYFEPMKKLNITRVNKFSFVKTTVTDQTAWTAYFNRADMKRGEKKMSKDWLESAVLVKEDGIWKISLLHSTTIKPKGK
jgi:hypothetical protein